MKWTDRTARQEKQRRIDSQRESRTRRIVREELGAADNSQTLIELISGNVNDRSAAILDKIGELSTSLNVVNPVDKVRDSGIDVVNSIAENHKTCGNELASSYIILSHGRLRKIVSRLLEFVHVLTSLIWLGVLIVALVRRRNERAA